MQWGWPTCFLARTKKLLKAALPSASCRSQGRTFNCLTPGGTDTELGRAAGWSGARTSSSSAAAQAGTTPSGQNTPGPAQRRGPHHRQKTCIPPPPASYLEANNVRDLHAIEIAFDLGNAAASCDGLQGAGRTRVAAMYRMGTRWPPYPCLSAQGTPRTPLGKLRDEAKAYLQALEVGLREAPTASKGKYGREAGFWVLGGH